MFPKPLQGRHCWVWSGTPEGLFIQEGISTLDTVKDGEILSRLALFSTSALRHFDYCPQSLVYVLCRWKLASDIRR